MLEAAWIFLDYVAAKYTGMSALRFQILIQLREALVQLSIKVFILNR